MRGVYENHGEGGGVVEVMRQGTEWGRRVRESTDDCWSSQGELNRCDGIGSYCLAAIKRMEEVTVRRGNCDSV